MLDQEDLREIASQERSEGPQVGSSLEGEGQKGGHGEAQQLEDQPAGVDPAKDLFARTATGEQHFMEEQRANHEVLPRG